MVPANATRGCFLFGLDPLDATRTDCSVLESLQFEHYAMTMACRRSKARHRQRSSGNNACHAYNSAIVRHPYSSGGAIDVCGTFASRAGSMTDQEDRHHGARGAIIVMDYQP